MVRITEESFKKIVEDYSLVETNGKYKLMNCNIDLEFLTRNSKGNPYIHVKITGVIPMELAEGFKNLTESNPEATYTNICITMGLSQKKPFPSKTVQRDLAPNSFAAMCSEQDLNQVSLEEKYGQEYITEIPIDSENILKCFLNTTISYYDNKAKEPIGKKREPLQ